MLPVGSETGRPAPMAAAMGSSMRLTYFAPALLAASLTAFLSTPVTPEGMQIITRTFASGALFATFFMKALSISAVMSKSAITPSLRGRTAVMEPGVLPIISLASVPTATTLGGLYFWSTATTEGSLMTMPLPFTKTRVLAVPKSIPISSENNILFSFQQSEYFNYCLYLNEIELTIDSNSPVLAPTLEVL